MSIVVNHKIFSLPQIGPLPANFLSVKDLCRFRRVSKSCLSATEKRYSTEEEVALHAIDRGLKQRLNEYPSLALRIFYKSEGVYRILTHIFVMTIGVLGCYGIYSGLGMMGIRIYQIFISTIISESTRLHIFSAASLVATALCITYSDALKEIRRAIMYALTYRLSPYQLLDDGCVARNAQINALLRRVTHEILDLSDHFRRGGTPTSRCAELMTRYSAELMTRYNRLPPGFAGDWSGRFEVFKYGQHHVLWPMSSY